MREIDGEASEDAGMGEPLQWCMHGGPWARNRGIGGPQNRAAVGADAGARMGVLVVFGRGTGSG
eukprot:4157277-Pyramimonas_sp.AAC.1